MKKYGFSEYKSEWWHYTLLAEPFPNTYFDFDII
jgi:D-alanyl-D-alanine dipeptidase